MEIQNGAVMLSASPFSHIFLIRGNENTLIDTGIPGQGKKILQELDAMGVDPKSIKNILITHHDVDHIGNAALLADATGAQIWAPETDIPYITREKPRGGRKDVINAIFRAKIPASLQPLTNGQKISGITAISAPGHTPGHIIFYYENIVFAGDLMRIQNGIPAVSPRAMNWDHELAQKSIGILASLQIDWICPAHGEPAKMNDAIRSFIAGYAK
jgi:glyoxylase-like metal-dependent hydrolase (beta-lactamase superfamily II)